MTVSLAAAIGAQPVVTTATDVEGKFSVDAWAKGQGLHIGSMALAKAVSAAILEGDVPICADCPLPEKLPAGLVKGEEGELGIYVGTHARRPFRQTLVLTPKVLTLGLGCRKNTPEEAIEALVSRVLAEKGLSRAAIRGAASIDLKAGEPGLLAFCGHRGIPVKFYSAGELKAVPGQFTPSAFVSSVTGVDNVCERAAAAEGGRITVPKTAENGVTVAISEKEWEVSF